MAPAHNTFVKATKLKSGLTTPARISQMLITISPSKGTESRLGAMSRNDFDVSSML